MTKYENECVGCDYCISSCTKSKVAYIICNECRDTADLYKFEGEELCIECVANKLPIKDFETCEECECQDMVWQYEDEWLCWDCLQERLERVY